MHQRLRRKTARSSGSPRHRTARPRSGQEAWLDLQRTAGNQAVVELVRRTRQPGAPRGAHVAPHALLGLRGKDAPIAVQRGLWGKIKKGVKKVGGGIKKVAKKVGGGIKKVAKKVGGGIKKVAGKIKGVGSAVVGGVKKVVKKVGGAIGKVASKVWTGTKWVTSRLWEKLKGIFLRVGQWLTKLPARLGRLVGHVWEGVKSLKPWSLKWWKSLGNLSTWKAFGKWLGELVIYGLEVGGIGEIYETAMDFIKFNTRALTGEEKAKGKKVFGKAVPWSLVRVDGKAILGPSWNDRAYVSFNTINGWSTMNDHTLIHELTHVWQYNQMGAVYMPKAIHAQGAGGGYRYGGVSELKKRRDVGQGISSFNLEQQGEILGDYYVLRYVNNAPEGSDNVQAYEHFVGGVRR